MSYIDPNTIHNPATGTVAPATWGDVIRDDLEFLIDPPTCSVFDAGGQTVTNDTITSLSADSENFDNDAMHSTVTNTGRITVQTAGRYEFYARVNFQANSTAAKRRVIQLRKNGTTTFTVMSVPNVEDGNSQTISGALKDTMGVGDYYEVRALQNSGISLTVTLNEFAALYITR